MALAHAALLVWSFVLSFVIVLVLKLDGSLNGWSWLAVFIPIWLLELCNMIFHSERLLRLLIGTRGAWDKRMRTHLLSALLCTIRIIFEVFLSVHLDTGKPSLWIVMCPGWLCAALCWIDLSRHILTIHNLHKQPPTTTAKATANMTNIINRDIPITSTQLTRRVTDPEIIEF